MPAISIRETRTPAASFRKIFRGGPGSVTVDSRGNHESSGRSKGFLCIAQARTRYDLLAPLGPDGGPPANVAQAGTTISLKRSSFCFVSGTTDLCQSSHSRYPSGRVSAPSIDMVPVRSQCRRHHAAECRHHRSLLHHRRRCSGMAPLISCISPAPAIPTWPSGFTNRARQFR
jgi:hypothetical protein